MEDTPPQTPPAEAGALAALANDDAARRDSRGRHLVRAAIVGIFAGLVAVAFKWALTECERAREALLAWVQAQPHAAWWGWSVLPLAGAAIGAAVGLSTTRFAPDAGGSGIPHVKGVLLHLRELRWKPLLLVKFVAGALGVGAGLSLGREGPTVQMGAAVGQAAANILRVSSRTAPQLVSCGAGAGLAAAFNAPLAGFLFVIEELHRELSARTFGGALVAAFSADIVARALGGSLPSFGVTGFTPLPLPALPAAAAVGLLGAAMGVLFNASILRASAFAVGRAKPARWLHPAIAGVIVGLVAWWLPEAVGGGHMTADRLLSGHLALGVAGLAILLGAKFVLTTVSYASGAPGGIFAPMLLIGAAAGLLFGQLLGALLPSMQAHATALAILGMAAVFTGSVRAPLTGLVLIIEMTGNYEQLLSLGITCVVADLTAGALGGRPIYEQLLEADLHRRPVPSAANPEAAPRPVYIGVQRGSALHGRTIREAGFPAGCLVVNVERAGREVLPQPGLVLLPGDHLSVLIPETQAEKALVVVRLATGI